MRGLSWGCSGLGGDDGRGRGDISVRGHGEQSSYGSVGERQVADGACRSGNGCAVLGGLAGASCGN